MVLKVYGSPQSTCTKRVGAVLHELKIPYEFHEISAAKAEHKSPEYLKKQPFGQVPYIVSDLRVMTLLLLAHRYVPRTTMVLCSMSRVPFVAISRSNTQIKDGD